MDYQSFMDILAGGKPLFMAGIGGISMRALAQCLLARGAALRGSDRDDSPAAQQLRSLGIPVAVGHRADNLGDCALLIRTAAVRDDNPEIAEARARGIPVVERAQAWGYIMRDYNSAVCIAGTHGKTSTTSMMAMVAVAAGLDPTVMVGGDLEAIGGPLRLGGGQLFVAEADEYRNSFLHFSPTVAVILNIDRDHVDFFEDVDAILTAFRTFAARTAPGGLVVVNRDDPRAMEAVAGLERAVMTFGRGQTADVWPRGVVETGGFCSCTIMHGGRAYAQVSLAVPGRHNLMNALAVAAISIHLGIPGEAFARGLGGYTGVGRRFEFKGSWRDAQLYDDYAHHPNEIIATLETARGMAQGRVVCVFQPHTYSRTAGLMDEFAQALSLADLPIICPIFAAREQPIPGVDARNLAARTRGGVYVDSLEAAARYLRQHTQPGDLILTMGAGDVWQVAGLLD